MVVVASAVCHDNSINSITDAVVGTVSPPVSAACYNLSCFIADIYHRDTIYRSLYETVHFSFTPWNYQYNVRPSASLISNSSTNRSSISEHQRTENTKRRMQAKHQHHVKQKKKVPASKNFHHAQPQAIASILHRSRGTTKWLMLFDIDEYALPRSKYVHFSFNFSLTKNVLKSYFFHNL